MNREEYVTYRNNKSPEPLYEYYKENIKDYKLMEKADFFMTIQTWPFVNLAYEIVVQHYDLQFNIVKIDNLKTGQIIKFL